MQADLINLVQLAGVDVNTLAVIVLIFKLNSRVLKLEFKQANCCG